MKGRYHETDKILDQGCGTGRNMHWFLQNGIEIYGIDKSEEIIAGIKLANPTLSPDRFKVSLIEKMPFPDNYFDHAISIAVLHFASSTPHFQSMLAELVRVVKPGGSLFIRIASVMGIEDKINLINDGVYKIPDGSTRFLLTRPLLTSSVLQNNLSFLEPLKTVNVDDIRCMSTLVLQKN
ncbi:MAG: class I SAM-dependent methyltransferase [Chitinophagaceae bacterium]|nr:class I SAM-dependent methyltransferase [Chitinophagaceae bacterium]